MTSPLRVTLHPAAMAWALMTTEQRARRVGTARARLGGMNLLHMNYSDHDDCTDMILCDKHLRQTLKEVALQPGERVLPADADLECDTCRLERR